MQTWTNLARLALIGTEHQPPAQATLGDAALDEMLAKLGSVEERESYLLKTGAALTLVRRAGYQPAVKTHPVEIAPEEVQPRCPVAAGQDLARMLRDYLPQVLPEWLDLAEKAGVRAPEELLPELLDHAKGKPNLRSRIRQVIGARGAWLAAQNPDWFFAIQIGADEKIWQEGKRVERLVTLREIRQTNPTRARELLVATWKDEAPEDRAEFVRILQVGISLEDEDFLEIALEDRRREVRVEARKLLISLPGSRFVLRFIEWASPLLQARKQVLRGAKLMITLPEERTREMDLCGVGGTRPPSRDIGEKAWWLKEMLDVVPPSHWVKHLGLEPKELIQAATKSEWAKALLHGWATAVGRYGDEDWVKAWLDAAEANDDLLGYIPALTANLAPTAALEAAVSELVRKAGNPRADEHLHSLIHSLPRPWSDAFSRLTLSKLQEKLERYATSYSDRNRWQTLLKIVALAIPPTLSQATSGWPKEIQANHVREVVDEFCAVIEFRRSIHRHFKGEN